MDRFIMIWQEWYATATEQYLAMQSAIGPLRLTKSELLVLSLREIWHDVNLCLFDLLKYASRGPTNTIIALLIPTALFLLVHRITKSSATTSSSLGLPALKLTRGYDYQTLLKKGAEEYPNTPYIITNSGYEYIVFPSSSFDEVKRLPVATASMVEWFTHVFFQGWRFLGSDKSNLHKTIGSDLTRACGLSKISSKHVEMAFETALGPRKGATGKWDQYPLFSTIQQIVSITTSASLLERDLATDWRWIKASQAFPMAVMVAVFVCHAVPRFIRPLVSMLVFGPAWGLYWYMRMLLRPMVERDVREYMQGRLDESSERSGVSETKPQEKYPMTAWLLSRYKHDQNRDDDGSQFTVSSDLLDQILHDYVVLTFESAASTAATIYFILAEMVTRPSLIQELREEMSQTDNPEHLDKLDSLMRESSRVNMFNYVTLQRRICQPVKLSIGPTLPPGSLICVDAYSITTSPELWKNPGPEVFDPLRFWKLRNNNQDTTQQHQHQFTSLGSDAPVWGGGSQACPGRVFAGNTIKIILKQLLMGYDLEVAPGAGKPKRNSMPNGSMAPDLKAKIVIRRRGE